MTKRMFITAAIAGLAVAVAVNPQPNLPRPMRPSEYHADQVAVMDPYGASAADVSSARRAGRTPVCLVGRANRDKTLRLCADKGFNVYAVAAGSAGN
jgi:hypothetical protein